MEILGKITITKQQYEHIKGQLSKLSEMEVCLSDYAVGCYELFDVINEKTRILYWIRVKKDQKGYVIEIIKEEQTPADFNPF